MHFALPFFAPAAPDMAPAALPPTRSFLAEWLHRHHRLPLAEQPAPTLHLSDDLGLDSLERVELVIDLEAAYHVDIPDPEIDELLTIQDVEACVQRHLAA